MPPALRVRCEDVQEPIRPERTAGDGEERDRLEDVLDDVARRDDIERVGGLGRAFDRTLDDVEAISTGEGRSFRIGLQPLHSPAEVSHDPEEVAVPASDIEEQTARRTRHGMDGLFALLPNRWDEPHGLAEEPLRRIMRESPVAVGLGHAPPAPGPEAVSVEGRPALHAVRVIRRIRPPDLLGNGARIQPEVTACDTLPERPRAGRPRTDLEARRIGRNRSPRTAAPPPLPLRGR